MKKTVCPRKKPGKTLWGLLERRTDARHCRKAYHFEGYTVSVVADPHWPKPTFAEDANLTEWSTRTHASSRWRHRLFPRPSDTVGYEVGERRNVHIDACAVEGTQIRLAILDSDYSPRIAARR
jgi:hypothetical protein